ncbi:dihydrofolate reductase family protein [Isoptericola hypogeus]|uniref:Dihydrofolate reductase family protein n=1 Tax=Isoptericola hypogeus TaxID=300179 RepID=A0ABP4VQ84_9MICO
MRTVYAFLMTSLDGYHADADGSVDWFVSDPEFDAYTRAQGERIDTIVMGRRTFELMASFWPTSDGIAEDPVVAGFMNDLPKVVASRSLTEHAWGPTTFVADDLAGHLAGLKQDPGKEIAVFGSSTLLADLLPTGVVDELRIAVAPVVLGSGLPLFAGAAGPVALERTDVRAVGDRVTLLTYRPTAAG